MKMNQHATTKWSQIQSLYHDSVSLSISSTWFGFSSIWPWLSISVFSWSNFSFSLHLRNSFSRTKIPFFLEGSRSTQWRVVRLCTEPKAIATTVHAKHMTLYGMLKSGVGKDTSRASVCSRKKNWLELSDILKKKRKETFKQCEIKKAQGTRLTGAA